MADYEDVEFRELDKEELVMKEKSLWQKTKEFCTENGKGVLILGGALFGYLQYKRGFKKGKILGLEEGSNKFCRDLVDSIMSETTNVTKF